MENLTAQKIKKQLEKIKLLGWFHATQGIYENIYSGTKKYAEFMAYHNGHNQGSWDSKK